MAFFESVSPPVPPRPRGPWLAPPDHQLAGIVPVAVPVGRNADTAVSVGSIAAYPTGVEITVEIRLRPGTEAGIDPRLPFDWSRDASRMVRFGVLLADGSRVVAADAGQPLVARVGETARSLLTVLPGEISADQPAVPSRFGGTLFGSPVQYLPSQGTGPRPARFISVWSAPVVYRLRYWLWPLPPAEPLTFVAEFPARGLPESRATVDGALVRAAADRAVTLWPTVDGLGEPGEPPADAATARADIRAVFTRAFTGGQGLDALAVVDDGEALRETLERVRERHPEITRSARVLVGEPVFVDPTHALIHFEVVLRNGPSHDTLVGEAVLVDGMWKVARKTYCTVMSWSGITCPDRNG